jgi:hypothetical protein
MRSNYRRRASHGSYWGRMAIHGVGGDLHHVGLPYDLGDEDLWRTMASRYGCEDGESDGRVIVSRKGTIYETADDLPGPSNIFSRSTRLPQCTMPSVYDTGKIMRLSRTALGAWKPRVLGARGLEQQ